MTTDLASAFAAWQAEDATASSAPPAAKPPGAAWAASEPTPLNAELDAWKRHLQPVDNLFTNAPPTDLDNPLVGGRPAYLSATQLNMAMRCPEQFRRRYVLGQKERPGAALIWGGADHAAHEVNFRQKIQTGLDLPHGDVTDAFSDAWARKVDEAGGESEVEWGGDQPGDLKTKAANLVALYHKEASPSIRPLAVEEEFLLELPDVPVPIKGFVDVREDNLIIERKTASKRTTLAQKPDWRLQGLIYGAQYDLPVAWTLSVKTIKPAVYTDGIGMDAPNPHQKHVLAALIRRVDQTLRFYHDVFGPDEAWPGAVTHPWACGFCAWRPQCAWWAE